MEYIHKYFIGFALFSLLSLSGCSTLRNADFLPIATPLNANSQQQLAIKRLSDILNHVDLSDEQKAELHLQRGIRYDVIGFLHLASFDFNQALKYKPTLAEAYNYLGVYSTLSSNFPLAYDAFDSVLELKPEHQFAYLNRGIALLYGGRAKLALSDFTAFNQLEPSDPYRQLWLYIAQREVSAEQAQVQLKESRSKLEDEAWATSLVDLYLGSLSETDFIEQLEENVKSEDDFARRLCEAYFYLAKLKQFKHQHDEAKHYFKLALAANVYEFVEHRYAKFELERYDMLSSFKQEPTKR